MKIAIITQPLRTNYGGILQNYALQTVLRRMGHTPITLMRKESKNPEYPHYLLTLAKRFVLKCLGKYKMPLFYERKYKRDYPIVTEHTLGFVRRHINSCIVDYVHPNISETDYDAYVVGSDQVWRPSYNNIDFSFLLFAKDWNVVRCAYAASFGTDEWEYSPSETERCRCLASKFNAISVREASAVYLCKNYFDVDAVHVLDPTLLLDRIDYEHLIDESVTYESTGQLFVHILDKTQDKYHVVEKVAKLKGWEPFEVNCKVDEHEVNEPLDMRIQPPVEQWLRAFRDAKFVVTDSFHATVFSIIFNKPFVVYANESRGVARFHSLLSLFGLENRIIYNSGVMNDLLFEEVVYSEVNAQIKRLRLKSLEFLKKGLGI